MLLAELKGSILGAIQQIRDATIMEEKVLKDCLKEIRRALLQADVDVKLVDTIQANIKKKILNSHNNNRMIIQEAIFNEFCKMLDAGKPSFIPKKGKTSVIMFVGLQGSGKTTACTKYAYYHCKQGWKPVLVCADSSRAGAFDQLQQNACKAKVPCYGSYMESNPVKIAVEGVERFKKENCDMIIIDTSGCHSQEASLLKEISQISEATKPDLVIYVVDGSIGRAAFNQAQVFKQSASVGAVIVTKMDGYAKGFGALSSVAATESSIIFIGTGVHMEEFESFEVKPFVNRLVGMGDCFWFMDKIHEVVPMERQPELKQRLLEQELSFRSMYKIFQSTLEMTPFFSIAPLSLILPEFLTCGREKECQAKVMHHMTIMDSMTDEELDGTSLNSTLMNASRIMRIARGSGRQVREVIEVLEANKRYTEIGMEIAQLDVASLEYQDDGFKRIIDIYLFVFIFVFVLALNLLFGNYHNPKHTSSW